MRAGLATVDDDGWEARMAQRARDRAQAELDIEHEVVRRKTATMGLIYRRWDPWRTVVDEPITGRECWKCGRPNPDIAHHVYEYVVSLLAERISKAYNDHQDSCDHCRDEGEYWASADARFHFKPPPECPERLALWDLLPPAYRPVIIG